MNWLTKIFGDKERNMKTTVALVLILLLAAPMAFAGAVDPCRSLAYQACAYENRVKAPNLDWRGREYYTCNPSTPEFKACEVERRKECKNGVVLKTHD